MKNIVFAKYNQTRKPEFQTSTIIYEKDKILQVEKAAINVAAKKHILETEKKYEIIKNLYTNIEVLKPMEVSNTAKFDYVLGQSIDSVLSQGINNIKDLLKNIAKVLDVIFSYNSQFITEFQITREFEDVFGKIQELHGDSLLVSNIDMIFDNLILKENQIYCIDYEWVFSFPIPINYIKFRGLYFFYNKYNSYLESKISFDDFFDSFSINKTLMESFILMEENFQQYVHGENREYIYTRNYEKKLTTIDSIKNMNNKLEQNEKVIHDLSALTQRKEEHIAYLGKMIQDKERHIHDLYEVRDNLELDNKNLKSILAEREKIDLEENTLNSIFEKEKFQNKYQDTIDLIVKKDKENKLLLNQLEFLENKRKELNADNALLKKENKGLEQENVFLKEYREKIEKILRNPLYGVFILFKKVGRKVLPAKIKKAMKIWIDDGFLSLCNILKERVIHKGITKDPYEMWIINNESNINDVEDLCYRPLISIVVPVYNVKNDQLIECIESVINQTYKNWELCLVDDCSTMESVRTVLKNYENNTNIKVIYRNKNGHICAATNDGINAATGKYIGFLDCDDVLSNNAVYEMTKKLNEEDFDFIYSDEDLLSEDGKKRFNPFFKPDWSPDTFMSMMYTCHFAIYRKDIVDEIGGIRVGFEGAQDYDFTLRFVERCNGIAHIPKILYHWRAREESTAFNPEAKPYAFNSMERAKKEALERRQLKGKVTFVKPILQYRVEYLLQNDPLISIIIPSKDNYSILKKCLNSIEEFSGTIRYEIIIVDNGSTDENFEKCKNLCSAKNYNYVYKPMCFNFSKMCNIGSEYAEGEFLLFLNDDIEVLESGWLEKMAGHASLDHVGAVGAKLIYPNTNMIQHVGIVNYKIGPGHCLVTLDDSYMYYGGRNVMEYNYIAVTGACLMIQKEKFLKVGKFNEDLPVAYNDVDLCFKLVEANYYNVVRNDVKLFHYESVSRGLDSVSDEKRSRQMNELKKLYEFHPKMKEFDPFYNKNLVQDRGDFSLVCSKKHILNKYKIEKSLSHKLILNSQIRYSIDTISTDNEFVHIIGWAFIENAKFNNGNKVQILLVGNDSEFIIVDSCKNYRKDVQVAFSTKRMAMVGFECCIKKEWLKRSNYSLSIIIKTIYGKHYYIQTTDNLILYS